MLYLKKRNTLLKHALVCPFIFSVIIPILILDLWIEIYHRVSFPLCGIQYINRRQYVLIRDRAKLQYLKPLQKIYCMYCGYANGVMRYWVAIASATEHYWCGIQHKKIAGFKEPDHHKKYAQYNDVNDFETKYLR